MGGPREGPGLPEACSLAQSLLALNLAEWRAPPKYSVSSRPSSRKGAERLCDGVREFAALEKGALVHSPDNQVGPVGRRAASLTLRRIP